MLIYKEIKYHRYANYKLYKSLPPNHFKVKMKGIFKFGNKENIQKRNAAIPLPGCCSFAETKKEEYMPTDWLQTHFFRILKG